MYCNCNRGQFDQLPQPLFRLICHCKTCQKYLDRPYNDECTFLLKDCSQIDIDNTHFTSYQTKFSPILRGKCKVCSKVSYCITKIGPFRHFVMIPTQLINMDPPHPVVHIYYDRRVADSNDNIRKVCGHFHSQLKIQALVFTSIISRFFRL